MFRLVFVLGMLMALAVPVFAQDGGGTLEFYANGEDFVRQGFVSKDGWAISFEHVLVNLTDIAAYQTDPPFEPDGEEPLEAMETVMLEDEYLVDLAEGDEDAEPLLIDVAEAAPAGRYNAVSWRMVNSETEDEEMIYALVIDGVAERDDEVIEFLIQIDEEYEYTCGEYVGDERKGILVDDGVANLELTFHFDHIFGDAELPMDDDLNMLAPGFDMLAALAEDGMLEVTLADLEAELAEEDYQMFFDILPTLGHTGEGHCRETVME